MANEVQWAALGEEERKQQLDVLVDAKRQVKIWLQLGGETMGLFVTLTGDAPQIFRQEALGERVAAMLNHNLVQVNNLSILIFKNHLIQSIILI
jgi:hypothetical protein